MPIEGSPSRASTFCRIDDRLVVADEHVVLVEIATGSAWTALVPEHRRDVAVAVVSRVPKEVADAALEIDTRERPRWTSGIVNKLRACACP